jgi:hypothetical protein
MCSPSSCKCSQPRYGPSSPRGNGQFAACYPEEVWVEHTRYDTQGLSSESIRNLSVRARLRIQGCSRSWDDTYRASAVVPATPYLLESNEPSSDSQFVGEMQEISSFISTSLGGPDGAKAASTYEGLADVFQRIADDLRRKGGRSGEEVEALGLWAAKAKTTMG